MRFLPIKSNLKIKFCKNIQLTKQKNAKICYIDITENKCKFYPYRQNVTKNLQNEKKKQFSK